MRNFMRTKNSSNENQISKVLRVIYNEFKNSLEHDLGKTSSNLTIPTKSNWWGRKADLKWYSWFGIMI